MEVIYLDHVTGFWDMVWFWGEKKQMLMEVRHLPFFPFFFVESCSTNSETNVTMVEVINHRRGTFIVQNSAKNQQSP